MVFASHEELRELLFIICDVSYVNKIMNIVINEAFIIHWTSYHPSGTVCSTFFLTKRKFNIVHFRYTERNMELF